MSFESFRGRWPAVSATLLFGVLSAAGGCGRSAEQAEAAYGASGEALRAEDYPAAVAAAARAVEYDPQHVDAWINLGIANSRQENWTEAIEAYERKVELDPYATLVKRTLASLEASVEEE